VPRELSRGQGMVVLFYEHERVGLFAYDHAQ
jgi:hypothetical protein